MLKPRTTFYSLLAAIILSVISLSVYLSNGKSFSAWFTVTNNANGSSIDFGSSFLFLFLIASLAAWINFGIRYLKYRKG
ncbi:conserved hypothetical protein [Oenococcus oeni]|uniref:hypothetical protein n=1 Tax=Oenococcus oeni TaxID=1247 RepID=UPI0010B7B628|nr:hypothetical protein [Oenococcus oeni]SYW12268.1 conserved hypothetical protein [Oenococcus oeni]